MLLGPTWIWHSTYLRWIANPHRCNGQTRGPAPVFGDPGRATLTPNLFPNPPLIQSPAPLSQRPPI